MIPTRSLARHVLPLALLIMIAPVVSRPAAAHSISLFNTGVDANEIPLSGGSSDPHWSIIAGPGITNPVPAVVVNNQLNFLGTYVQSPDSRWVWADASGVAELNSPYTFQLSFDLTGFNPTTATISGSWGVDNDGSILLNGSNPVGSGALTLDGGDVLSNFTSFHSFQITGGFVSGINTLDFLATDLGAVGALNVNSLVGTVSEVPEPSTLVMVAIGAIAVAGFARRPRGG
ncbi:MAG TPA: PEP-CTERM sorting domain-containing protein [Myxococcota bacterium]|nr:PEP-CTERM sorting domain-containing protein [Myxococcota bacterium]